MGVPILATSEKNLPPVGDGKLAARTATEGGVARGRALKRTRRAARAHGPVLSPAGTTGLTPRRLRSSKAHAVQDVAVGPHCRVGSTSTRTVLRGDGPSLVSASTVTVTTGNERNDQRASYVDMTKQHIAAWRGDRFVRETSAAS